MAVDIKGKNVSYLNISDDVANIQMVSDWLSKELKSLNVPDELLFKFDLCTNELLTNIITYAFPSKSPNDIKLAIRLLNKKLTVEIQDNGVSFNPLEKQQHEQPSKLDEAELGGLGIDIVRHYMVDLNYQRQQGANILQMNADIS
jgi:anti-sigma regulatory factor (Ser/Thr protein kinase)